MNRTLIQPVLDVLSFNRAEGGSSQALVNVSEKEWTRGLDWLDRCGLSLYFWDRIRQRDLWSSLPLSICSRLEKRRALNIERTRAMVEEWKHLQDLFVSSGVRCLVLKGLATVPDYCPDPSLRVQFDHDWLIEKSSLERTEKLLVSAGYRRKKTRERDRVVYVAGSPTINRAWDPVDSYAAKVPRPVELHLRLWDSEDEKVPIDFAEDWLARSVERTWDGRVFAALSDEDALMFEALHAFRHIIHNWCRLSVLYEIAHFLDRRRADQGFWQKWLCRFERRDPLLSLMGVVLRLAASVFRPFDVLDLAPARVLNLTPELQVWVDHFGTRSALANFSTDKFSLFLLREFVNNQRSWREVRRRRLFPLQIPRRVRREANERESFVAKGKHAVRILRRFGFHVQSAALYAWEVPQWRLRLRRERKRRSMQQPVALPEPRLVEPARRPSEPKVGRTVLQASLLKRD